MRPTRVRRRSTSTQGGTGRMEFNLAQVHEAVAAAVPDRECIVWRDRRLTYAEVGDRTRRLANHLLGAGLGAHTRAGRPRPATSPARTTSACYLHNGNEYLEAMLGVVQGPRRAVQRQLPLRRRGAPLPAERRRRAGASCSTRAFADRVAEVLPDLPDLEVLLQVDDGSGAAAAARAPSGTRTRSPPPAPARPDVERSPDDLYILYTGGTTGMPKGVLWRQADIFVGAMGGRNLGTGGGVGRRSSRSSRRPATAARRLLPAPPFMHGAGHWLAFNALTGGNTIVHPGRHRRLRPRRRAGAPSSARGATSC